MCYHVKKADRETWVDAQWTLENLNYTNMLKVVILFRFSGNISLSLWFWNKSVVMVLPLSDIVN